MQIEERYRTFTQGLEEPIAKDNLDFLGINIFENGSAPVFKAYYATRVSPVHREHPLVAFLYSRDMLRDFELVKDTISSTYLRLDTAIKNRNNENMEALFAWLLANSELFEESKKEVLHLARMKMTDLPEHDYTSIYHLGITEKENKIDSLKWYFFTKWCEDPNKPARNSEYRDAYYLEYLNATKCAEYEVLVQYAEKILEACSGHLWMVGLDIKNNFYRKYKIYIKISADTYDNLAQILSGKLEKQVIDLKKWHQMHPEFEFNGMAICLDTEGVLSMNAYYGYA